MSKKRVLWISEASFLNTGFSVLSHGILKRLHNTNKFELAEFGSYSRTVDPRVIYLPWKFYGTIPEAEDTFGTKRYNSSIYGQFGEALFEQVCLDFKPDIVISSRDPWMSTFESLSPFKKYFKWIYMPTIDGEPQKLEWLDLYSKADLLLTYSKYAKDLIETQAPRLKIFDVVRPGVDHTVYIPQDKLELRKQFGLDPNSNIILTVMRNQRRKLYPDLIEMFASYLKYCTNNNRKDLANNTYLYLHTSYPDVGFDIARHILDNGIGHRVIVTYKCQNCNVFYPDFFQSELTICKHCGQAASHMPNTNLGVTREDLVKIYNLADLYIQYSICEGLSLPLVESKSCGIPAMGVDYSAMSEQVNIYGCWPIRVEKFFHEPTIETEQKRALPDNQDAIEKVFTFFNLPKEERNNMAKEIRKDVVNNYSLDRAARIFERAIDSIEILDPKTTWYNPEPQFIKLDKSDIPQFPTSGDFIDWCFDNLLKNPALKKSYWRNELVKALNVGFIIGRNGREQFNSEKALEQFRKIIAENNMWEDMRIDTIVPQTTRKTKVNWELA